MLTRVEALHYRCLRYVGQDIRPLEVLLGPNASGKTTFLDVIAFLGRLVSDGLDAAIEERTANFQDLLWQRRGSGLELAVEARIPAERLSKQPDPSLEIIRYEIAVHANPDTSSVEIRGEKVVKKASSQRFRQIDIFPSPEAPPDTLISAKALKGNRLIANKVPGGNDNFYSEAYEKTGKGWVPSFRFGPKKSALGNLPPDESKFPAATWLKDLLTKGIQPFILNSLLIRRASPPGQGSGFKADGSNLPWVVESLRSKNPAKFNAWLAHVQTALPDLQNIRTVEREDDRHRYLILSYPGVEVPSWTASDGTLRLLALTLSAYLPDFRGVYLIEEPENGIHPRAVETVFQSLSSVYDAQILMATHSPVMLSAADIDSLLCFSKDSTGATDIVPGPSHPALRKWRQNISLGDFFASGVLG